VLRVKVAKYDGLKWRFCAASITFYLSFPWAVRIMKNGEEGKRAHSGRTKRGASKEAEGAAAERKAPKQSRRRTCTHSVAIPEGWEAPEDLLDPEIHGMLPPEPAPVDTMDVRVHSQHTMPRGAGHK
jgi:hypothetical protein